jgi:hypothetical protein
LAAAFFDMTNAGPHHRIKVAVNLTMGFPTVASAAHLGCFFHIGNPITVTRKIFELFYMPFLCRQPPRSLFRLHIPRPLRKGKPYRNMPRSQARRALYERERMFLFRELLKSRRKHQTLKAFFRMI